jgi:hypothetical protein
MSSENNFFDFSKVWMSISEKRLFHIENALLDVLIEYFDDSVQSFS